MSSETASKKYRRGQRHNPVPGDLRGRPNRKAKARLDARLNDYVAMTAAWGTKCPPEGSFHRPGSQQGPR